MSEFVVSARKYRPDTFGSVIGQTTITHTLKNAIRSKSLAQAYLFCGPRGVGKTTCARIFAKTINCRNLSSDTEACNECESCKSFSQNRSFNIHELDAASNNSVDDIRNLIEQVRIPPQVSAYSVYIIDEIHMLSQAAFNAFLKTLEEPPKHAVFILATTEKHKIIPTILSRCQIFDFNRIRINDIVDYLKHISEKENVTFEEEALNVIAQKADGAMRDALSVFDQLVSFSNKNITYKGVIETLNILDYEYYFRLTGYFLKGDYKNSLILFDEVLEKGFDPQNFIAGLNRHFRELLVSKSEKTLPLMEVGDVVKKRYTDQASECSDDFLFSCIELCNECDLSIKASKNQRLHVEIWLIKLCNLTQKKKADVEDDSKVLDISQETEPENHNQEEKKEVNVEIRPADKVEESEVPVNGPGVPDALNDKPQTGRADDLSITEALKTVDNHSPDNRSGPKEEVVNANGNEERGSSPAAKIDTADFLSGWNEFVKSLKKEEPRMYSALRNQAPDVTDGSSIVFSFINNAQMQEFKQKIRPLMVSFFKERTDLTGINIEAILYKEDKEPDAKFLTEVDKLKHMTSKNPVLQKLRQEFNLDFE